MRKILLLFIFLPVMGITGTALAKDAKPDPSKVELVYEAPTKKYTKLGPLWESAGSVEKSIKNLQKKAAKMGADAIIDIQVGTQQIGSANMLYGISYPQPVVQGWAVKWTGE